MTPGRSWRRPVDPLRLACHLAAELPFVVLCVVELHAGWRPTSDDAVSSWRAWNAFSSHPTLLGAPTHGLVGGGYPVFAPGPVLSWLLAVPVHLDPLHGGLWGSALLGAVGAGVAVEAGAAAAGRWGMALCAGAIVILASTRVGVVLHTLWTPWIGAVLFLTTLAAAWAVACGRLGWWLVVVASASLAVQAHVIYALPAVGLCLVSVLVGRLVGRPQSKGRNRRWIGHGLICAAVLWLPTLVQQLADRPGNLTLIWRSSQQPGGKLGFRLALSGLSSATGVIPSWVHRVPVPNPLVGSSLWGGVVIIVLLAVGTLAALGDRRWLAAAAFVASAGSVLTVAAVASVPRSDALELFYLGIVYVPVGIMAWLVMAGGVIEVSRWGLSRLRSGAGEPDTPISRSSRWNSASVRRAGWLTALTLVAASAIVTASIAPLVPSDQSEIGGPNSVDATATAARQVESKVGRSVPFELEIVGGSSPANALGVYWGTAYSLFVMGWRIRLGNHLGPAVGSSPALGMHSPATVTVVLDWENRLIAVRPP